LRREAGTLAFDGAFRSGKGSGTFRFTPSPEFVQNMKGLRYSNLPIDQLLAFATQDVTTQFVKDLNNLGYRNVPADDLLPSHSRCQPRFHSRHQRPATRQAFAGRTGRHANPRVSPEFVAQMKSLLGKNFDVDDYVAFRIHGVSPNSSARSASTSVKT